MDEAYGLVGDEQLLAWWTGLLPVSAVGGVLLYLGAEMLSPSLWRAPVDLVRLAGQARAAPVAARRRAGPLAADWAVTAAVALCALVLGLAQAVVVGATQHGRRFQT